MPKALPLFEAGRGAAPGKRAALAATLLVVVLSLGGCSTATIATSGPAVATVPAAGSSLAASEFAAASKLPDTVLLDVRTPAEFASGHLPGALNIDVESADFSKSIAALDRSKTYAVYCRSANRSKVAMTAMKRAGFTKLFDLAGGINAWQSAGGEVVRA